MTSPLELIAAVNRMEGRDSGPLTAGYVDESGREIVPEWPAELGMSRTTLPSGSALKPPEAAPAAPTRRASLAEIADAVNGAIAATSNRPSSEVRFELPALDLPPDYVRLDTGAGVWRDASFTLSDAERGKLGKLVAAAIARDLRERVRDVRAQLVPRKPRRPKRATTTAAPPEPAVAEAPPAES